MQASKIFFALAFVALGAGGTMLVQNWDSLNNKVLAMLHRPHFVRPRNIEAKMEPVTITGEVVDSWCYASQTMGPGQGLGHVACATACILGGVTPGILEDKTGEMFVAVKYTGYKGCNELLAPYIGKTVTVRGWMGYKGDTRVLKIATVELVSKGQPGAVSVPSAPVTNSAVNSTENSATGPANSASASTTASKSTTQSSTKQDQCEECKEDKASAKKVDPKADP
ncbi:MAG TPA: hypothetical protein V6C97_02960 [Oculatellaceae cyanobacterium]